MGWLLLRLPASHTQLSEVLEAGIPDLSGVCSMNQSAAWLSLADLGFLFLRSATSVTTQLSASPNFVALVPRPALCPSVLDFLNPFPAVFYMECIESVVFIEISLMRNFFPLIFYYEKFINLTIYHHISFILSSLSV